MGFGLEGPHLIIVFKLILKSGLRKFKNLKMGGLQITPQKACIKHGKLKVRISEK